MSGRVLLPLLPESSVLVVEILGASERCAAVVHVVACAADAPSVEIDVSFVGADVHFAVTDECLVAPDGEFAECDVYFVEFDGQLVVSDGDSVVADEPFAGVDGWSEFDGLDLSAPAGT